jgi:hypothetical protein
MTRTIPRTGLALAAIVLAASAAAIAEERLRSGPQPGARTEAFDVRDLTGPNRGKTLCYV